MSRTSHTLLSESGRATPSSAESVKRTQSPPSPRNSKQLPLSSFFYCQPQCSASYSLHNIEMTDQTCTATLDDIIDITPPSSFTPRRSAWTGRLPPELFMKILEILGERGAADTVSLCRLQRTSSAVYWIVTPILHRHLKLTMKSAVQLFDVFNLVPPTERVIILDLTLN